jgi:hypothetical protein
MLQKIFRVGSTSFRVGWAHPSRPLAPPLLTNLVPIITIVFGLMAYYNARYLSRWTVPLFRRELDKQLTVMVLVQVLISFCTLAPLSIVDIFSIVSTFQSDPVIQAKKNLARVIIDNHSILNIAVRVLSIIFYFHEILPEISQFSSRFYLKILKMFSNRNWYFSVTDLNSTILLFSFFTILESILYICLYFTTVSSSVEACFVRYLCQTISTK